MKVLSWNIRGSSSSSKRRGIKAVLCKELPDIVVLQEVKRRSVDRRFVGSIWKSRFVAWILLQAEGRSGGILVMWDVRRVSVVDNLVGSFSISIRIEEEEGPGWWFTGVYGPCRPRERSELWDELAGLSSICGDCWCVGGDFNVVRFATEKNRNSRISSSMKIFDEFITENHLYDFPLANADFTWSNLRESPTCCRIDRFLCSDSWFRKFPYSRQEALPRCVSDHTPILLDSSPAKWGPSPFRLDSIWVENKEFLAQVKAWWPSIEGSGRAGFKCIRKL